MSSTVKNILHLLRKFKKYAIAKEDLRLEKERFDTLVDAVEDYAIFTLDPTGVVKSWNAGAERFKGYKAHEILGRHFSEFYPVELKATNFPAHELEQARIHGKFKDEGLRVRKDGTFFWANVTITAIYDRNRKLTGFLKVTQDISERKQAEENQRKLNEELEQRVKDRTAELIEREKELQVAKEIAEAANVAKSNFVANISHEIRTPLGAILGFAELLADGESNAEERAIAQDAIKRNGQLLTDLINDVLDLSKVEANRLEIERDSVALPQLLEEVRAAFKLRAESKNVEFYLKLAPGLPPRIWTDALRVKQILFNVVGNAIKFTRAGSVSVEVFTSGDEKLYFAVEDTGVGISEEQAKKLFVPFQQADPSITREFGGTGLGLILSKKLAAALGGDLMLTKSAPGVGTQFMVSIHLAPDDSSNIPTDQEEWDDEKRALRGKRILIVDDNPDNRLLISKMFKPLEVILESAADGRSGVEKALEWKPDLILMDLQMPLMGGLDATEELRSRNFDKPIIALTAHALKEEKERCLQMGFDAYITKPIDKSIFFTTLSRYL